MKKYRTAWIAGWGGSGRGAARLLASEDCAISVYDLNADVEKLDELKSITGDASAVLSNEIEQLLPAKPDVCIVSPGFLLDVPILVHARKLGIPLLSELELGWSRLKGRVLAVTGSNGKSSALNWCAAAMTSAGLTVDIAGNYGPSVAAEAALNPERDWWLLEVSSFQLETCRHFQPDVALLLNILPNHLDRHGSMDEYSRLKFRIFAEQKDTDAAVLPVDFADRAPSGATTFGLSSGNYQIEDLSIWLEGCELGSLQGSYYGNEVLAESAAGIWAALRAANIDDDAIQAGLQSFKKLPHRQQELVGKAGVRFIDNSKATNIAGLQAAIRMVDAPVRLIAGGRAKEKDFSGAKEVLAHRVRKAYLIGEQGQDMAASWGDTVPCCCCDRLEQAFREAVDDAVEGEVVLLAPGCTSFDQFASYAERGRCFQQLVNDL